MNAMSAITDVYRQRYVLTGAVLWVLGAGATYLFLRPIIPDWSTAAHLAAAVVIQVALTTLESLALTGQGTSRRVGQVAFAVDTLINAAALLPYMRRVDDTNAWFVLASYAPAPLGSADGLFGFALALLVGAGVAIAPEILIGEGGKR